MRGFLAHLSVGRPQEVEEVRHGKLSAHTLERRQCARHGYRAPPAKCVGNYEHAGVGTALRREGVGQSSEVVPVRRDEALAVNGCLFELAFVRPFSTLAAELVSAVNIQAEATPNPSNLS
jgi:hypothetical protein